MGGGALAKRVGLAQIRTHYTRIYNPNSHSHFFSLAPAFETALLSAVCQHLHCFNVRFSHARDDLRKMLKSKTDQCARARVIH